MPFDAVRGKLFRVGKMPIGSVVTGVVILRATPCESQKVKNVLSEHIVVTPGTCGGQPRIAGHRIKVAHVAIWHERMGLSADEIADQYGLSLSQVYAALAYYYDNREEIDAAIRAGEGYAEEMRKRTPSLLREKLGG